MIEFDSNRAQDRKLKFDLKKSLQYPFPCCFDSCDWRFDRDPHRMGPSPHFWKYACHSACHYVCDLALYVAMKAYPEVQWRVVSSQLHSTVWNGSEAKPVLFDINFHAIGVAPSEAWELAISGKVLPPGKPLRPWCSNKNLFTPGFKKFSRVVVCGDGKKRRLNPAWTIDDLRNVLLLRHIKEDRGYKTKCWIWIGSKAGGYGNLRWKGKPSKANRLAWIAFRGEIPHKKEACHHCDVPSCINPKHLFIGTHRQNMLDAAEKGIMGGPTGEDHYCAKLTVENVKAIKHDPKIKALSIPKIASMFGVTPNAVRKIRNGESWKHVK